MHLHGLDMEAAIKSVTEHPWKQFKEVQAEGEELIKTRQKQKFVKKRHSIHKLTNVRLENGGKATPPAVSNEKSIKENQTSATKSTEASQIKSPVRTNEEE